MSRAASRRLELAEIVLLAASLRAGITAVGPLVDEIRAALGLSGAAAGLLTTLPLLAFAACSPAALALARRLGATRVLVGATVAVTAGLLVRSAGTAAAAFAGTAILGAGVAAGNVLLPGFVKQAFPRRGGLLTSVYVTVMVGMAGVAAAVSVPLADDAGLGWRGALAVWALPAGLAACLWLPKLREHVATAPGGDAIRMPLRSALAWELTLYMGLQALVFYGLVAWLPEILRADGVTAATGGLMLGLLQIASLAATMGMPVLAVRSGDQRLLMAASSAAAVAGLLCLLVAPAALALPSALLLGLGTGAWFSLALTFLLLRSGDPARTAALSGMVQSIGYLIAACGPTALGAVHDAAGDWSPAVVAMVGVAVLATVFGVAAARDRVINAPVGVTVPAAPR